MSRAEEEDSVSGVALSIGGEGRGSPLSSF
jgi:hypothetical protein